MGAVSTERVRGAREKRDMEAKRDGNTGRIVWRLSTAGKGCGVDAEDEQSGKGDGDESGVSCADDTVEARRL